MKIIKEKEGDFLFLFFLLTCAPTYAIIELTGSRTKPPYLLIPTLYPTMFVNFFTWKFRAPIILYHGSRTLSIKKGWFPILIFYRNFVPFIILVIAVSHVNFYIKAISSNFCHEFFQFTF